MRLLCWLVLSVLLVESLQKKDSQKTTLIASKTTEAEEGSGGDSDSSEERTEETTIADEKKSGVPILPLDDGSNSDEAINKALDRNSSKKRTEHTADPKSSDLVVLGENSAPETKAHDGDPLDGGKLHPHEDPTLNEGKGGAAVNHRKHTENPDHVDQVPDAKNGKVIAKASEAIRSPPNGVESTTIVSHESTEVSTPHPTSTTPSSQSTTHSHETTSVHGSSSSVPIVTTHEPVHENSTSSSHTEDPSHSTHASTAASSSGSDSTIAPSSSSTNPPEGTTSSTEKSSTTTPHASIVTKNSGKPGGNAENIDEFKSMDFQAEARASCESPEACSQNLNKLQCIGAHCEEATIRLVTCNPETNLTTSRPRVNTTSSRRYTVPIKWTCGSSDFEPDFQMRNSSVVCEGFNYPGDHWIVQNSCILRFHLEPPMNSSELRSKDEGSNSSVVAIILTLLAVTGMGYFVIKAVILKRRHGHWVPSYCALPLKARMNFRRKRQTNFDEEPVNVHFDMGEEQTNIGRTRVRSYGVQ